MRRLSRYSIRSLLVLVTVACLLFGWYGVQRQIRLQEVAALQELEKLAGYDAVGCYVHYEDEALGLVSGYWGEAFAKIRGPRWLTTRLNDHAGGRFYRIARITLVERFDDRSIPHLAQLRSLESIHFVDSHLSDAGKAQLRHLFPDVDMEFHTWPELGPEFDDDPFATGDNDDPFAP